MDDNGNLMGFMDFESFPGNTKESQTNKAVNKLRQQNAISDELNYLTKTCKNEQDLLTLRTKIIEKEYKDLNKGNLLTALDDYINEKLADTIKEASLLSERRKEKNNLVMGAILIVIVGFFLTDFFRYSFPIAVILAVLGWWGSDDRKAYKASQDAMEILKKYESAGYQINYKKEGRK